MRLAIVGSRDLDITPVHITQAIINHKIRGVDTIVTGDACGVDKTAREYASANHLDLIEKRADWNKYHKSAGPIRNTEIVSDADYLLSFWDGQSPGSLDSIVKAMLKGIPVRVVFIAKEGGLELEEIEKRGREAVMDRFKRERSKRQGL